MHVLVIDQSSMPIGVIPYKKAIKLIVLDKVLIELSHTDKYIHTVNTTIAIPKIIKLKYVVKFTRGSLAQVSNKVLFIRDNYTCQYCGGHQFNHCDLDGCEKCLPKNVKLTRDHVKPVDKFEGNTRGERKVKADSWDNVVTACLICNGVKANRLPFECHMYPLKTPKEPIGAIVTMIDKMDKDQFEYVRPFLGKSYK